MSAISLAITQLFNALTVLFTAFESICKTADNLATVAEESSGQYRDQARINRAMQLSKLEAERRAAQAVDNATSPT